MSDRYLVISSDCHAGPEAGHYRDYIDPKYRDAYDAHLEQMEAFNQMRAAAGSNKFREEWLEETGDGGMSSVPTASKRDELLDADGVAAEVIFPDADVIGAGGVDSTPFGSGIGSSGAADGEHVMAGARAHNRWLAEMCSESPDRRGGVAPVPILHDPVAAVAEIEWAAANGLKGGIMIPSMWSPFPAYHDPIYDPVWAACAANDMTVHIHSGGMLGDVGFGPGMAAIIACEAWFVPARPLWIMLLGGVFERHPNLRLAITEDGAWWVPDVLDRADEKYLGLNHNVRKMGENAFRDGLTMKPSEYFNRNCWIGASTPSAVEISRRHGVGIDNLLWGNDFPHPEGTWPHTHEWIAIRFHDVPEDETRKVLGTNALACYPGFDADKLEVVAQRIGPTVHDIHVAPVPDNPDNVTVDDPDGVFV